VTGIKGSVHLVKTLRLVLHDAREKSDDSFWRVDNEYTRVTAASRTDKIRLNLIGKA
jgi:hypothetical protein